MFENIKHKAIVFPDAQRHGIPMSKDCMDFITRCLSKDPSQRLGSTNSSEEILQHPWFKDVDQTALFKKDIVPEFISKFSDNADDVTYFDQAFTEEEARILQISMIARYEIKQSATAFDRF